MIWKKHYLLNKMKIYITFFICFFVLISLNAQDEQQFVEITGTIYKPKRLIKSILEDLSKEPKCFETDNPFAPRFHYLHFSYNEDTDDYFLVTKSTSNFISKYNVSLIDLNFSGIFYYKEYIVLLNFDNDKTENRKKFFKETDKKLKIKVPVTDTFEPYCYLSFKIMGCTFIPENETKHRSWDPIIINH